MEKKTKGYTTIPSSLSMSVLKRAITKGELDHLTARYVRERNKGFLINKRNRGNYCPHCGKKLPIVKP